MSAPDPYQGQPPAAPQYQQAPYPAQYPANAGGIEVNGKAVAALVCGVLFCTSPLGIIALVLGNTAKREIEMGMGIGRALAKAGRILGWIGIAFTIVWVLYIISIITLFASAASSVSNY